MKYTLYLGLVEDGGKCTVAGIYFPWKDSVHSSTIVLEEHKISAIAITRILESVLSVIEEGAELLNIYCFEDMAATVTMMVEAIEHKVRIRIEQVEDSDAEYAEACNNCVKYASEAKFDLPV